jgi:hypothetical protein
MDSQETIDTVSAVNPRTRGDAGEADMAMPKRPEDLVNPHLEELRRQAVENGQHPRTRIVMMAKIAMAWAVLEVEEKYDLTAIELVQCLADVMQRSMKYPLRVERHGNSEYPADAPPASKRKKAVRS